MANFKTLGCRELWFYAVDMLYNVVKFTVLKLVPANTAALTLNFARTI